VCYLRDEEIQATVTGYYGGSDSTKLKYENSIDSGLSIRTARSLVQNSVLSTVGHLERVERERIRKTQSAKDVIRKSTTRIQD